MTSATSSPSRKRRHPVARAVPSSVLRQIDAAIRSQSNPSGDTIADLYDRFDLAGAYNVSRSQFTHYARNLTNNAAPPAGETKTFPDESAPETAAFRKRIAHTGRALSAIAEALANDDPVRWGRGVYLALLGRVFDVLDGRDSALSLDDLAVLSKIVAEQRRAETQASELRCKARANADGDPGGSAADRGRPLPDEFRELVHRLYGTNLQDDVRLVVESGKASEAGE